MAFCLFPLKLGAAWPCQTLSSIWLQVQIEMQAIGGSDQWTPPFNLEKRCTHCLTKTSGIGKLVIPWEPYETFSWHLLRPLRPDHRRPTSWQQFWVASTGEKMEKATPVVVDTKASPHPGWIWWFFSVPHGFFNQNIQKLWDLWVFSCF